jgi:superfamily I DNA/RNA helicase
LRGETAAGSCALRKLILLELTPEQRRAVDAPYADCFAILGAASTGKSTALAQRAARLQSIEPAAQPLFLRAGHGVEAYALELLRGRGSTTVTIDDVEAEAIFTQACLPLFAMEWEEFARNQLDPEVPGLRSPERFAHSAFRLIRRLRDADIQPAEFLSRALAGATEFYANPPNLAEPALLAATKTTFHDSLDADPQELLRQRRREVDLAKILTKLYQQYLDLVRSASCLTPRDAVIEATRRVREDPGLAASLRERHRFAFVDDAQELTPAHLALVTAIFGERLPSVTLCGDPGSAISSVRMSAPDATFATARSRVELRTLQRVPERRIERFASPVDEADAIAERVGEWLAQGVPAERIALLFRSVRAVERYEKALLDRGIPAIVAGDFNVFGDRRALDALALLWSIWDPFRHDWLLRVLASPALGLSDASLALLCGEPPDPQRPLFELDDEPPPAARASRWNPQRDLRLGWNVLRGERDSELGEAAQRVARFRAQREHWLELLDVMPFNAFARHVWREGLAREGEPGSPRARAQQIALQRLLDRLDEHATRNPQATLGDILAYAEQRIFTELESCVAPPAAEGFVQMLSVEAARGREFDHVVVANVRPGAFPRWYSPEAFLFSPRLGMIPKENVGEARASRTAKFSYYSHRAKAPQRYFERERRAFVYALRRARKSVLVTAGSAPTRGRAAPEFLEELRRDRNDAPA